jgi:hypothetical protein
METRRITKFLYLLPSIGKQKLILFQTGDIFFGCATSDEFPNQISDCEKKMIKDLDKVSKICARKDNSC